MVYTRMVPSEREEQYHFCDRQTGWVKRWIWLAPLAAGSDGPGRCRSRPGARREPRAGDCLQRRPGAGALGCGLSSGIVVRVSFVGGRIFQLDVVRFGAFSGFCRCCLSVAARSASVRPAHGCTKPPWGRHAEGMTAGTDQSKETGRSRSRAGGMTMGADSRFGLSARSSSTTYLAYVPSENATRSS